MKSIHNEKLDVRGPLAQMKYLNIQSLRYVSNEIRNLKESIYSKIYFTFSLIFAVLIAIFAQSLNWMMVLIISNLLMLMLIFFAKRFHSQRREHIKVSNELIEQLRKLGVKIEI